MSKRVVLFDFDGVIANTEESNARYFEKALASFGIYLSEEDKHKLIGTKDNENVIHLLSRAPKKVTLEELQIKRKEIGNTYENSDISPMPGLISLIENLRKKGLKIGVVSSTSTRGISQNVKKADFAIDSYEDCKKIFDEMII